MTKEQREEQEVNAQLRLAAFEEFLHTFRQENIHFYGSPLIKDADRAKMDDNARKVFYRGFDAGVVSKSVITLWAKPNT